MNFYSDSLHTTVDFLFNKALHIPNLPNLLYMGGDFNVRNAEWDLSVSSHSVASQVLRDLVDSYSLACSVPVLPVPIQYLDIHVMTQRS